jgi:hypothetical protein
MPFCPAFLKILYFIILQSVIETMLLHSLKPVHNLLLAQDAVWLWLLIEGNSKRPILG